MVLDAVADARAEIPRAGLTHRIEHCGFPTDDQIGRMRSLGVVPVPQPTQVHLYADSLIDDFGDFGARLYPYGSFEAQGLPVIISSDAPVTTPGPLRAAWAAITRTTARGDTAGPSELQASRAAALFGITRSPARLLGRDDIGTLAVGARADLVLLDADPVTVEINQLPQIAVTETWVAGAPVSSLQGAAA
jgi:hypothetical protein